MRHVLSILFLILFSIAANSDNAVEIIKLFKDKDISADTFNQDLMPILGNPAFQKLSSLMMAELTKIADAIELDGDIKAKVFKLYHELEKSGVVSNSPTKSAFTLINSKLRNPEVVGIAARELSEALARDWLSQSDIINAYLLLQSDNEADNALAIKFFDKLLSMEHGTWLLIHAVRALKLLPDQAKASSLLARIWKKLSEINNHDEFNAMQLAAVFFDLPSYKEQARQIIEDKIKANKLGGSNAEIFVMRTLIDQPETKDYALNKIEESTLRNPALALAQKLSLVSDVANRNQNRAKHFMQLLWNAHKDKAENLEDFKNQLYNDTFQKDLLENFISRVEELTAKPKTDYDPIIIIRKIADAIAETNLQDVGKQYLKKIADVALDNAVKGQSPDLILSIFELINNDQHLRRLHDEAKMRVVVSKLLEYAKNSNTAIRTRKRIVNTLKLKNHPEPISETLNLLEKLLKFEDKIRADVYKVTDEGGIFAPHSTAAKAKLEAIIPHLVSDFKSHEFIGVPFVQADVIARAQKILSDDVFLKKLLAGVGEQESTRLIIEARQNLSDYIDKAEFWDFANDEVKSLQYDGKAFTNGIIFSLAIYYIEQQKAKDSYSGLVAALVQALASSEAMRGCKDGAISGLINSIFEDEFKVKHIARSMRDYIDTLVWNYLPKLKTILIDFLTSAKPKTAAFNINDPKLNRLFENIAKNEFMTSLFDILNGASLDKIFGSELTKADVIFRKSQELQTLSKKEEQFIHDVNTMIIMPAFFAFLSKDYYDMIVLDPGYKGQEKMSFPDLLESQENIPYMGELSQ